MDPKIIFYIAFGLALLGLTWLPHIKRSRFINVPLLYFFLAVLLFNRSMGLPELDPIDNETHTIVAEYLTEIIVIVSLAGAGLAIDRTFRLRGWQLTWRLLAITMPLSIAAAALLGHWLFGLPLADAILLGACLAPTDPVMASSVQVGPPNEGGEDPVRFGLTTEAGLNDGLAFPFVYLALGVADHGGKLGPWLLKWTAYDLAYKVAMGVAVGAAVGWLLGHYAFRISDETARAETREGLFVTAAIFLSYGLAEALHGYGFLAVFAAAVASRQNFEKNHEYYQKPYQFATQLERIFAGLLLLALGGFVATANIALLSWSNILFAVLFIAVARPLSGLVGLVGQKMGKLEKGAIAFLGIRGFGSFYYLAYAQNNATTGSGFENIDLLWGVVTLTVLMSLFIHGNSATLALGWIDRRYYRRRKKSPNSGKSASQTDG